MFEVWTSEAKIEKIKVNLTHDAWCDEGEMGYSICLLPEDLAKLGIFADNKLILKSYSRRAKWYDMDACEVQEAFPDNQDIAKSLTLRKILTRLKRQKIKVYDRKKFLKEVIKKGDWSALRGFAPELSGILDHVLEARNQALTELNKKTQEELIRALR